LTKLLTFQCGKLEQDGTPEHTARSAWEWLRANCRFCCIGSLASKFAGSKPRGLSCVGCNVGDLSQTSNKAKNNYRTQGNPGCPRSTQLIWDNLPRIDKAVKDFSKRLKALKPLVDTLVIQNDNVILIFTIS